MTLVHRDPWSGVEEWGRTGPQSGRGRGRGLWWSVSFSPHQPLSPSRLSPTRLGPGVCGSWETIYSSTFHWLLKKKKKNSFLFKTHIFV